MAKSETGFQRVLNRHRVIRNFVGVHFTAEEVPAVKLGIIEGGLTSYVFNTYSVKFVLSSSSHPHISVLNAKIDFP